jgi:molecular chaperone GrpE
MTEIDPPLEPTLDADRIDEFESVGDAAATPRTEPGIDLARAPEEERAAAGVISMPGLAPAESPLETPLATNSQPLFDAIENLANRLGGRIDALQTAFDRELRAEANRERVIDRLHAELQEYKQDLLLKIQRPIFVDLIQLHDDIGKMVDAKPKGDEDLERAQSLRAVVASIQTAIEDILYRQGVEPYTTDGDDFDPRRQRAISTQPADDASQNKKVASRLRKGFQAGDKVIRPEVVSVFTYRPSSTATQG